MILQPPVSAAPSSAMLQDGADETDMPWSDLPFDSSGFIVVLIIINHLNMLAELAL